MLAGVDEAGRGPVLGPLVIGAVLVDTDAELRDLGVKDSKLLQPARREELDADIRRLARRVEVRVIHAEELNRRMPASNLNKIEVDAFAGLLRRLQPKEAVVDACDVDADRFGHRVAARLRHPCIVRAEHKADARHPVVAAASIVAKVERDRWMKRHGDEHGACGSGYASDPATKTFLADYVATHRKLPPIARAHWETSKRLLPPTSTLMDF